MYFCLETQGKYVAKVLYSKAMPLSSVFLKNLKGELLETGDGGVWKECCTICHFLLLLRAEEKKEIGCFSAHTAFPGKSS